MFTKFHSSVLLPRILLNTFAPSQRWSELRLNWRNAPIRQVRVNSKAGPKFTAFDSKEKGSKPDRAAKQTGEAAQGVLHPARPSGGPRPQLETGYCTLRPLQHLKGCRLREAAFQVATDGHLPCRHPPASAGTSIPGSTLPQPSPDQDTGSSPITRVPPRATGVWGLQLRPQCPRHHARAGGRDG